MEKVKKLISKYLTPKVRTIIALVIIVLGSIFLINYSFFEPTYINKYISMNIYKKPANSYFDDQKFYNCVVDAYNRKNNTSLGYETKLTDNQLNEITRLSCVNKGITSAKGLEKLTKLTYLDLSENQLTSLDASKNLVLEHLNVYDNLLTSLDVSKNTSLIDLDASNNLLTSLDVSNNLVLEKLYAYANQLEGLNLAKNTKLDSLLIFANQLTSLDVSKNTALEYLNAYYNKLTSLDVSKNTALTKLDVSNNQLTSIKFGKNTELKEVEVYNNQLKSLDLSKATLLTKLYANNNNLTSLDLSKNTKLVDLNLKKNNFNNTNYCYVGDSRSIVSPVILPSILNDTVTWESSNKSIATVNNNGKVVAKKIGTTTITETSKYYTATINVNAFKMTSDKYSIYNYNGISYIYTKTDLDYSIIKSHLTVPKGTSINMANYKIEISDNNGVIKTFDVISFERNSNDIIAKSDYIFAEMIDLPRLDYKVEDGVLVRNGTSEISDNKFIIKYNGVTVDTIPIIYINTDCKYDMSAKYIYVGDRMSFREKFDTNGDIEISRSDIILLYNNKEIARYSLKAIETSYKVRDDYIYTGNKVFNKDNVELYGVDSLYKNNVFKIIYNHIELDSFNILTISFNDLQVKDKRIIIDSTITKNKLLSKVSKNNNNITFKILNDDDIEIGSTDSLIGNYLKVYYNDKEIDSYDISDAVGGYVEFDEKLKVKENKKVIYDVKVNTKLKNIIELIDTNGIIKIYDKNDTEVTDMESKVKTGYKIKIELSDKVEEYKLSVRGDTKGTGEVNILSAMKIINHILKTEEFVGDEYYMAADLTGDNQILINDAMRIIKYILYGEEL